MGWGSKCVKPWTVWPAVLRSPSIPPQLCWQHTLLSRHQWPSHGPVPRTQPQPQHGHTAPLPPPAAGDGCGDSGGPGSGTARDGRGWAGQLRGGQRLPQPRGDVLLRPLQSDPSLSLKSRYLHLSAMRSRDCVNKFFSVQATKKCCSDEREGVPIIWPQNRNNLTEAEMKHVVFNSQRTVNQIPIFSWTKPSRCWLPCLWTVWCAMAWTTRQCWGLTTVRTLLQPQQSGRTSSHRQIRQKASEVS